MAATIPDFVVPKKTWTNLYTLTGITAGAQVVIFNKGSSPFNVAHSTSAPTDNTLGVPVLVDSNIVISSSTFGIWLYSENSDAHISMQEVTIDRFRQGASLSTRAHTLGMDFNTAVALNLVPGCSRVAALGNNPDIDTATFPEDIWPVGGLYPWPTAATLLQIVSSSASDNPTGVGAATILITGLDANYATQTETITLNGLTPVISTKQFLRVNGVLVMSKGTGTAGYATNVGDIDVKNNTTPTDILARIQAGTGISRSSIYTVPAGFTLAVNSAFIGINRPTASTDATVATFFGNSLTKFYRLTVQLSMAGNPYRHDGSPEIMVAEKFDFCLRGVYVSNNNSDITGAWNAVLFQNSAITAL